MEGYFTLRIRRAIVMASKAHMGQVRKEGGIPYIAHLWGVTFRLALMRVHEDIIIAAALHDTLEDTALTPEQIVKAFGWNVLRLVVACTEPSKELPWEERKEHTINILIQSDMDVKLIACADKVDNIQSIYDALKLAGLTEPNQFEKAKVWNSFKRGYESQKWYYQSVLKSLFANVSAEDLPPIFGTFMRLVEYIFAEPVIIEQEKRKAVPRIQSPEY